MHETRNFVLVIALVAAIIWAVVSWFILDAAGTLVQPQRFASLVLAAAGTLWLFYALVFEDKLPDHLKQRLGGIYYEVDGLCFMPIVRAAGERAELSLYYQNRFENPAEAVVHMRPVEECFVIKPGMRDVHFAFRADGGDFGVIRQPIAVPRHLQGDVIDVRLAAASYYPRSHGARLRREAGLPCGSLHVDWGGAAFKSGVHEGSGEIELISPATLHLSMPSGVSDEIPGEDLWRQEQIAPGKAQG